MNISLTRELEGYVSKKVESGMYHSASEVIREGLRLLKEHEEIKKQRLTALRQEIAIGIKQADQGHLEPFDIAAIKKEGRKRRAQNRKH